ncbi:transforming acidic coiled-coil-containing protein 3-like isoform X2 [Bradysia coprophila]|uniref:transforming acidic coiled-coil-containing protein 3-like isoform X2 n=1 Tax=Bradysia coprophila TaxID=38358 RepID=UPI00187D8C14|nr:transforming acidic coiled-coil-containing protein 3-like isoform X2 [Bradysia coprophila]
MENIESPARPTSMNLLTRPIERNVLRELNSIEATKSPKETSLADITETHAKDDQAPVIQTNNRLSDGSDKAPLNKNLLRVSTPTETASVSDDEEFVDCNTTFNSSVINSTFEAAAILSDGNFGNPEQRVPSPNESEGPGISNKKLNLGFIETKMSGVDDLDQDKSTVDTLNSEDGECGSKDSKDSTISSSFIENSQIIDNDHHNKSIGEISSDPNANSSTEGATVPMITIEGVLASQTTIDEVAAVVPEIESASIIESALVIESNPVMNVESKPIIETEPAVESTTVISAIESVAPMELELADRPLIESDSLTNITVESVVETMSAVESTIESADVINSNPAINEEPKPMIETEPVIETKPVISASELESPVETELADRPALESDSLTNITVESVVETMSAVESTIESAAVIESSPAINEESKPIIETKPVLESTLAIESTTAVSVIESVPTMESELAHRPVNESDSLTNINVDSVIETMTVVESTIESAVVIESNPVINEEPTAVISDIASESPMESELADRLVVESDSLTNITVESVIETMAAVESTVESAVVTESNPVSNEEPKHLIETEPVLESTLEIESTPVISAIESVAPMESDLADRSAVESGTTVNVDVEPVIETVPEIESTILHPSEPIEDVIQSAVVIASNTEINAESPIESDTAIKTELSIETKSANELEPSRESENVGALAISILQPTPIIESETAIETESTNELDPSIESAVISQSEPTQSEVTNRSALASDPEALTLEATIESQPLTELEPVAKCELTQVNNALNVTCNLDGTSVCQPEPTFDANNDEITQNVRIETSSSNREPEFETTVATESETIDDAKVTQANKISEFKANQSFSVDSLDQDTEPQDCSLDSLEMKVDNPSISAICSDITERFQRLNTFDLPNAVGANFDHPGAENLNASISTLSRKDTFSVSSPQNESIPSISRQDTYSLLLPQNESITSPPSTLSGQNSQNDSRSSVDDITVLLNKVAINSPIVNAADSSNRMKRSATFEKSNSDGVNQNSPSLSADGSNASGSKFQTTPVPNLNAIDSKQDDLPEMVLSPNDFDFLQSRGGKKTDSEEDRRNSLLLRFDPLSGRTVQKQHLAPTEEVVESSVATVLEDANQPSESSTKNISNGQSSSKADSSTANASEMSVSLVHDSKSMDNDTTNSFKNNIKADIAGGVTMTDKKIKFEYADENIRKKMEEYEATQEILVKRLAEKEKTLAKNCAIIEVYEKTLAELVADKEKLTDHHEVTNERLRQERDIHHQHLMSLEITFSDLHKKYERSKEIIMQLRERYDVLSEERAMIDHLIKQQELRYEKMKQHAIEQLEHANSTLEEQEKSNARENSRLKALLKIEEVSRNTMQEQLSQKCKENKELVKICDELIGGSGQRS